MINYLTRPILPRWWSALLIGLLWALMAGLWSCGPVSAPDVPALHTIIVDYVDGVGRIIIPGRYQGGITLCVQDSMAQGRFACAKLVDLRRVLPEQRYAEEGAYGGPTGGDK